MGTDLLVPGDPLIRRIRTEILDGTSDKKAEIFGFRLSLYIAWASLLFILPRLEALHLLAGQEAPLSPLEIFLRKPGVVNTVKFLDRITQMLENTAHDAVAARMDLDPHLRLVLLDIGDLIGKIGRASCRERV